MIAEWFTQVDLFLPFSHSSDNSWVNPDLHKGNIAFEIPDLDGKSEEIAMMTLDPPQCVPVFTRDQSHQSDSLPKYLVLPGNLVECVKQDNMRVKIIDFGEGSSLQSQSCCWALSFRSILQRQSASTFAHPVTSTGAGSHLQ